MSNDKLPFSEASGKKPLHGTYKVSFTINVESEDNILASDFGLFITEGFGENLVEKVASLDVEKIYKVAKVELKAGDLVYLNQDVEVMANIVKDNNGIYCVGALGTSVCEEYSVSLQRGLIAEVNKIEEGRAELIGFDNTVEVSLLDPETDEPFWVNLRLDKLAVNLDAVEKIENTTDPINDGEVA